MGDLVPCQLIVLILITSVIPHAAVDEDVYDGFYIPKGEYPAIFDELSVDTPLRFYAHSERVVSVLYILPKLMSMTCFLPGGWLTMK